MTLPAGTVENQLLTFARTLMPPGPDVASEPGYWRLITGEPHPMGNMAIVADPDETPDAMEPLRAIDAPSAIVFLEMQPPEIETLVGEHGYALAESMPAMAVDIERELTCPDLPDGHGFVEIDAGTQRDAWNRTLADGYGLPLPVAERFGPVERDDFRSYAVTVDDAIVATATLFLEGGLAGIYCVATLPEHRGKGLGGLVTAEPLRRARAEGYSTGILQSSAMGESVYRGLGFRECGMMPLYVRM